jgi:serine/threonine protein phosphatase PrpC
VRICRAQEGDELLLACDGLWDVLSPEAAFDYLHAKKVGSTPRHAVQQLVRAADEEYNSSDNVSVVYAHL